LPVDRHFLQPTPNGYIAATQSPQPCLLKHAAPQEYNGGVWVGGAVGFQIATLAYKILAEPILSYGSEAWTFQKQDKWRLAQAKM